MSDPRSARDLKMYYWKGKRMTKKIYERRLKLAEAAKSLINYRRRFDSRNLKSATNKKNKNVQSKTENLDKKRY